MKAWLRRSVYRRSPTTDRSRSGPSYEPYDCSSPVIQCYSRASRGQHTHATDFGGAEWGGIGYIWCQLPCTLGEFGKLGRILSGCLEHHLRSIAGPVRKVRRPPQGLRCKIRALNPLRPSTFITGPSAGSAWRAFTTPQARRVAAAARL